MKDDITDLEQLILRLYYDPKDTDGKDAHVILKDFALQLAITFGKELNDRAESEEEETD